MADSSDARPPVDQAAADCASKGHDAGAIFTVFAILSLWEKQWPSSATSQT